MILDVCSLFSPKLPFDSPSLILPRVAWAEASVAAEPTEQPPGEKDELPLKKLASVDKFTLFVWSTSPGLTLWTGQEGTREDLGRYISSESFIGLTRSFSSSKTGQETSEMGESYER